MRRYIKRLYSQQRNFTNIVFKNYVSIYVSHNIRDLYKVGNGRIDLCTNLKQSMERMGATYDGVMTNIIEFCKFPYNLYAETEN